MKTIFKHDSLQKFSSHNPTVHKKQTLLDPDTRYDFLVALGVQNQDGSIHADHRKKFTQIAEFLKVLHETIDPKTLPKKVYVYDFGCGNAYITFAVHYYFLNIHSRDIYTVGIDQNSEIIDKRTAIAKSLRWQGVSFVNSEISRYNMEANPTVVMSLHACDTASDDAMAKGINAKAPYLFIVPCCHNHIQQSMSKGRFPTQLHQIASHGILYQRTCDIVTDTFRALILRIKGYKTDIFEFVDTLHSAKNLMIRGVILPHRVDTKSFIKEYEKMKKFWGVTPYIESLIKMK
jgi:Methyltransferase domain